MLEYTKKYFEHKKQVAIKRAEVENEIEKRRARINRAKKQIARLEERLVRDDMFVSWIDDIVTPLMKDLEQLAGEGWTGEIYGPFGIECRTSIYLRKDMSKSITEQPVFGITITPPDKDGMMKYETGEKDDTYRQGSLGDLNGMNYIKAPLPDAVSEIWEIMKNLFEEDENEKQTDS